MEARGLTPCIGCGALVEWRTNKQIYCEVCRLEKKRAVARVVMTKQRIAKGIKPVKGIPVACSVCGAMYDRGAVTSHRCPKCQAEFTTVRTRIESAKRKHSPEKKAKYNAWTRNALASSPAKRVSSHFSVLIHRALGKKKSGRSWRTFVDYTLEELMTHLERQFSPGMTWENRGKWHIDHILPRSSFQYDSPDDEQFKACWALSNLRPLWAQENLTKQASRLFLI